MFFLPVPRFLARSLRNGFTVGLTLISVSWLLGEPPWLRELESNGMVSKNTTRQSFASNGHVATDGDAGVDQLLKDLSGLDLARRITDAARLATAKHVYRDAQLMQSAVEAENSTKLA